MPKTAEKNSTEKTNIVWLAGIISSLKTSPESAFLLLDAGPDKKFVPCTVYQSKQLAEILDRFSDGDFIKVVGFVRPWSEKKDGTWKNHMEVRITEVKTTPPAPRQKAAAGAVDHDDDIPF